VEETFKLDHMQILGTPPPREVPEAWTGRQAAMLDAKGRTVRIGEVRGLRHGELTVRLVPDGDVEPVALLIRDAGRDAAGRLATITQVGKLATARREPLEMTPPVFAPQAGFLPVSSHLGPAWATLVGGVIGDPLLHVRFRDLKKSLLFDLGDPARLAAKVAHQVSGVFISHAHLDHIGGFIWFLRSRLGPFGPCKIFGPLGIIDRIESFLGGITWDRIEEKGPIFEVCEIEGTSLKRARLQPGKPRIELLKLSFEDGVIMTEENFTIKAVVCDHKTPSVAYGLVFCPEVKVRKERLAAYGLSPGPWLGQLKHCIAIETPEVEIELPNGSRRRAEDLAKELTIIRPGKKLVYAADMADTPENRKKLTDFARSAHTFFCETAFTMEDKDRADANQHLTTLAAMSIAREAGVERLVPFHFSKRYQHNYRLIYEEILTAAGSVQILGHFF
jgi:ribonuclease BN (tRNA processing enzyme)